jgi:hypothetical protein
MLLRNLLLLSAALLLSACESGTARVLRVTMGSGLEAQFSSGSRGLLVADLGGTAHLFVVLCGQGLNNPLVLSQDLGFGCLGDAEGTQETIRAWVEPVATETFACSTEREFYVSLGTGGGDGGAGFAAEPLAGWAQGTTTGTWRRDLSPCGGVLNASITLDSP